ncbi:hypothetical protein FI667_g15497, partial [Globisporangium splendens]
MINIPVEAMLESKSKPENVKRLGIWDNAQAAGHVLSNCDHSHVGVVLSDHTSQLQLVVPPFVCRAVMSYYLQADLMFAWLSRFKIVSLLTVWKSKHDNLSSSNSKLKKLR